MRKFFLFSCCLYFLIPEHLDLKLPVKALKCLPCKPWFQGHGCASAFSAAFKATSHHNVLIA